MVDATPLAERLPALVHAAPLGVVRLPEAMKQEVIFRKYQSQDPMLTDVIFGEEVRDQIIEHERLGLASDDGCIIDIVGRRAGQVGITKNGEVLTIEQVEMREEATPQTRIPRFVQYLFFVDKIVKTNGPALRENLLKTAEQQRLQAEEHLVSSLDNLIASRTGLPTNPSKTAIDVKEYLLTLAPEQRKAMLEMAEAEAEYQEELAAAKKK